MSMPKSKNASHKLGNASHELGNASHQLGNASHAITVAALILQRINNAILRLQLHR